MKTLASWIVFLSVVIVCIHLSSCTHPTYAREKPQSLCKLNHEKKMLRKEANDIWDEMKYGHFTRARFSRFFEIRRRLASVEEKIRGEEERREHSARKKRKTKNWVEEKISGLKELFEKDPFLFIIPIGILVTAIFNSGEMPEITDSRVNVIQETNGGISADDRMRIEGRQAEDENTRRIGSGVHNASMSGNNDGRVPRGLY